MLESRRLQRRRRVPGFALLGVLVLAAPLAAGTITGRVTLIEKGGRNATDLSDVVVYVDSAKVKPRPSKVVITMKGKTFTPHLAVVPVGGTVEFPNDDPIFHNVFSVSGENRFDLSLYKRPKSGAWTFEHPGVARVYCNIHPQMSAVVLVLDNPFYARATSDGAFLIEDVPPGSYLLKAWHERGGEASAPVTVTAAGRVSADLALDASKYKLLPHKKKDGKDYDANADKY
jgi:plastocyanin